VAARCRISRTDGFAVLAEGLARPADGLAGPAASLEVGGEVLALAAPMVAMAVSRAATAVICSRVLAVSRVDRAVALACIVRPEPIRPAFVTIRRAHGPVGSIRRPRLTGGGHVLLRWENRSYTLSSFFRNWPV
jgi:hypothetical protein